MVLCKARSQWISQENQVNFEQTLKLSINLLIFPMVNTFPWMKTRLIRFPPSCRVNLLGCIFLKRTKDWFFVLFLSYVYFFENDIFSKWWHKHFRGARNHFFSLPKHGGQTFNHIRRLSGKFEVILIDLFFPFKLQSLKKILRADLHWSAYLLDNNKISTFCPEEDVLWSDFYLLIEPFKKKSS